MWKNIVWVTWLVIRGIAGVLVVFGLLYYLGIIFGWLS